MATTADIKKGLCIKFNNGISTIVEFQHVKPGKGPAFVRTKLKSLTSGKIIDNTFSSGHKIDIVRVERRKYQYLYNDDLSFHFMNTETFEQTFVPKELIEKSGLLKEGNTVELMIDAEEDIILTCELPTTVDMEIAYTEPGIKGDTATNALKIAKIETGMEIKVPLFIEIGNIIRIDTATCSYKERVN